MSLGSASPDASGYSRRGHLMCGHLRGENPARVVAVSSDAQVRNLSSPSDECSAGRISLLVCDGPATGSGLESWRAGALRQRMLMSMRAALLAFLMIGTLAPASAASAAIVPIDVVPVSPANGGVYRATNAYTVAFTARWARPQPSPTGNSLFVEVTNQNIAGQDGTLADDQQYRVGGGSLDRGDADPTTWTGNVTGSFPSTPGRYFFQFYAFGVNADCGPAGGVCTLASPVFSFSTQPAAPPPQPQIVWKLADAQSEVRRVIRHETKRSPSNLRRSCARVSSLRFSCRADWRDATWVWAGTLRLRLDTTRNEIDYSFNGRRARRACLRKSSLKRCARRVSF